MCIYAANMSDRFPVITELTESADTSPKKESADTSKKLSWSAAEENTGVCLSSFLVTN